MSVTATDIYNSLAIDASIKGASASVSILQPINLAIENSWPGIKLTERALSVATLAANTFEYSLSGVTPTIPNPADLGPGVAQVFVVESSADPEIAVRDVRQMFDQSDGYWKLIFSPAIVNQYVGKVINIVYQRPQAVVTQISDAIYLPRNYLTEYCNMWYALKMMSTPNVERAAWARVYNDASENVDKILKRRHTPLLSTLSEVGPDRMRA